MVSRTTSVQENCTHSETKQRRVVDLNTTADPREAKKRRVVLGEISDSSLNVLATQPENVEIERKAGGENFDRSRFQGSVKVCGGVKSDGVRPCRIYQHLRRIEV